MTLPPAAAGAVDRARTSRRRERRLGFGELLAALTRGLDAHHDIALLRGTFETMLRRIVPVRTIHLRDLAGRWSARDEGAGIESIALEIPGADAASQKTAAYRNAPARRLEVKVDLGSWQQAMARLDECAACGHVDERRVAAWADARRDDAMVFQAVPPPRATSILSRVGHNGFQ